MSDETVTGHSTLLEGLGFRVIALLFRIMVDVFMARVRMIRARAMGLD